MEAEVQKQIRGYVVENFLYTRPDFAFTDDDPLLRKGVVDSLGVMELISFIEQTWDISIPPDDITEANFSTVAQMAKYVAARMAKDGSPA